MTHQQQCPQATNNPARPTSETCPAIPESGDLLTKTKRIQSWKTIFSHWNIFTILYDEQSFSQSVANLSERSGVEVDSHNNAITRSSSRFVLMAKFDRWFNKAIKWFSVIIHHQLTTPSMLSVIKADLLRRVSSMMRWPNRGKDRSSHSPSALSWELMF